MEALQLLLELPQGLPMPRKELVVAVCLMSIQGVIAHSPLERPRLPNTTIQRVAVSRICTLQL